MKNLDDLTSQVSSIKGTTVLFFIDNELKKGVIQSMQIVIAEKNYVFCNVEEELTKEIYRLSSAEIFDDEVKTKQDLSLVLYGRITKLRDTKEKIDADVSASELGK
jgi:hypothetical protein